VQHVRFLGELISSFEQLSCCQDASRGEDRLESRLLNFLIDLIIELFFGSLLNILKGYVGMLLYLFRSFILQLFFGAFTSFRRCSGIRFPSAMC